jgi:hypothetical protein
LGSNEASIPGDRQDHHYHHHRRTQEMNELIQNIGELVKSILKIVLLGETPDEPTNPNQEEASD